MPGQFRRRRDEILLIVRHYDSDIGDGYHQFSLERRIDEAAKATTPWEFTFILRGDWQNMRGQLNGLRDHDRAAHRRGTKCFVANDSTWPSTDPWLECGIVSLHA